MKPICVPCERFYRMKKSGFYFIEGMPRPTTTNRPKIGKGSLDWEAYKVWAGDLYECPTCGHQLVSGVGYQPVAEHYQPNFADIVESTNASQLLIKDC